ncbi:GAF domain-containing sensor histidine kinase [Limnovirga soli]|uniref:histidine kinase n=1 Tax=Limnovirga soli TaxID=2656915 RepID=A0A8J8JS31_9BACT|nr:HAMP domain-containing sensor histidine kinase [Limnovirga soli]NNV54303.1 sensor histidine kinase [Limnovirga soli]
MENTDLLTEEKLLNGQLQLSEYDVDYSVSNTYLQNLSKLAASIAGTEISFINLLDSYTQWTISNYGFPLTQMPVEDSVCQYTIRQEQLEVKNLALDDRFSNKDYVTGYPKLKYYFGIPLQTEEGNNIGALCVLDKGDVELTNEKVLQLKAIANEIVSRLKIEHQMSLLKDKITTSEKVQKKLAHDIRGPIGGVIGLSQLILRKAENITREQITQYVSLIEKSSTSLIDLVNEILNTDNNVIKIATTDELNVFNLSILREKLLRLYTPQAILKNIEYHVQITDGNAEAGFSKSKVLQIAGNVISNAIKFTPHFGKVLVELQLQDEPHFNVLQINITDSGVGLTKDNIKELMEGASVSQTGTSGEKGFGLGLNIVKHLIDSLHGTININSTPGKGTAFEIKLPQKKL